MMRVGKKCSGLGDRVGATASPGGHSVYFSCSFVTATITVIKREERKVVFVTLKKKSALPVCHGSDSLTQCFVFFGLLNHKSLLFWFWEVGLVSRFCLLCFIVPVVSFEASSSALLGVIYFMFPRCCLCVSCFVYFHSLSHCATHNVSWHPAQWPSFQSN